MQPSQTETLECPIINPYVNHILLMAKGLRDYEALCLAKRKSGDGIAKKVEGFSSESPCLELGNRL